MRTRVVPSVRDSSVQMPPRVMRMVDSGRLDGRGCRSRREREAQRGEQGSAGEDHGKLRGFHGVAQCAWESRRLET